MLQNRGVTCGVLHILTWKCAWRHSGVQFLDIWPSKSGPNMWCFAHFDLQMCFAPQRRIIFEHRNFKTGFDRVVFCAFWLANVLRATAAYHFCGSELPNLPRDSGVLRILSWKCALPPQRHTIFADQKWQNRSRHEVFCIVWLENVLRAVAILHRSAEQLPPHPPL